MTHRKEQIPKMTKVAALTMQYKFQKAAVPPSSSKELEVGV